MLVSPTLHQLSLTSFHSTSFFLFSLFGYDSENKVVDFLNANMTWTIVSAVVTVVLILVCVLAYFVNRKRQRDKEVLRRAAAEIQVSLFL